jgi:hypothetical protein
MTNAPENTSYFLHARSIIYILSIVLREEELFHKICGVGVIGVLIEMIQSRIRHIKCTNIQYK